MKKIPISDEILAAWRVHWARSVNELQSLGVVGWIDPDRLTVAVSRKHWREAPADKRVSLSRLLYAHCLANLGAPDDLRLELVCGMTGEPVAAFDPAQDPEGMLAELTQAPRLRIVRGGG
jgi:hypothetical protein